MKVTAFALLISGVFSMTVLPFATAAAEDAYSNYTQGQGYTQRGIHAVTYPQTQSRYQVMPRGRMDQSPYQFRPWSGNPPQESVPAYPNWRETAVAYPGSWQSYPGVGNRPQVSGQAPQGYRLNPAQNWNRRPTAPSAGLTYQPANLKIPNNYVYRPLNPVKRAESRVYTRPQQPILPQRPAYSYNTPYRSMGYGYGLPAANQPRPMMPPQPRARYVYGSEQYSRASYRPIMPANSSRYRERPSWMSQMPRFTANRWAARPRFRPSTRFDRQNYRRPSSSDSNRYPVTAYMHGFNRRNAPDTFPSAYQRYYHYPPVSGYPTTAYDWQTAAWGYPMATYPQPYSSMPGPQEQNARSSPSGVDWYDGRSDGEGAWYKIAEQQEWPRVSENQLRE